MSATPIHVVDAFTDEPFRGNPAAVCLLEAAASEPWMQAVAAEMRHSETAFVVPADEGFDLRWFTPEVEVDLCGHGTLAAAHVLWTAGRHAASEPASFHTRSGRLGARRDGDWIVLDFPASALEPVAAPDGLIAGLGVRPSQVAAVCRSPFDYLVELDTAAAVRELDPDFLTLRRVETRGIAVTASADEPGIDFVSRFFGPAVGVDEDPVTGSAHCALGPYWGPRLGRDTLVGRQVSARGGTVRVRLVGDRVELGGRAVTILVGHLQT